MIYENMDRSSTAKRAYPKHKDIDIKSDHHVMMLNPRKGTGRSNEKSY